jgi:hypothetical protein
MTLGWASQDGGSLCEWHHAFSASVAQTIRPHQPKQPIPSCQGHPRTAVGWSTFVCQLSIR